MYEEKNGPREEGGGLWREGEGREEDRGKGTERGGSSGCGRIARVSR